jgi:uncharacterized protein (TIRG00374 family)
MMGNKKGSGQIRVFRSLITLLLIGLAVHILLPQIATFEHSLQVVKGMAFWALGLAIISQALSYLGSGYLLRGIASLSGQPLSPFRGMMITAASYSIGLVAGGLVGSSAATYRWMRASNVSAEPAMLAGWLPGILDDMLLIVLAMFGLLFLLISHSLTTFQVISFLLIIILLSLIFGGAIWARQHHSQITSSILWVTKRWAALRRRIYNPSPVEETVDRLFRVTDQFMSGGWRRTLSGACLSIFFDMASLYFIFLAAGHAVRPGVLLVGYGLPLLFGKAPLLPGGVGIVEATMVTLYDSLGVPDPVTVVVILTYRFLSFWLPLLLGFPMIPYLQRKARDLSPEGMSLMPSAQHVQPDTTPPHRRMSGGEP